MRFLALVVALVLAWFGGAGISRVADERVAELVGDLGKILTTVERFEYLRGKPMSWRHRGRYAGGLGLLALAGACLGVSVGLGPWWGLW